MLALPNGAPLAKIGSLKIAPGARVLVRGASGSGKSTLLRALAGLWPFGEGQIDVPVSAKVLFVPQISYIPDRHAEGRARLPVRSHRIHRRRVPRRPARGPARRLCGSARRKRALDAPHVARRTAAPRRRARAAAEARFRVPRRSGPARSIRRPSGTSTKRCCGSCRRPRSSASRTAIRSISITRRRSTSSARRTESPRSASLRFNMKKPPAFRMNRPHELDIDPILGVRSREQGGLRSRPPEGGLECLPNGSRQLPRQFRTAHQIRIDRARGLAPFHGSPRPRATGRGAYRPPRRPCRHSCSTPCRLRSPRAHCRARPCRRRNASSTPATGATKPIASSTRSAFISNSESGTSCIRPSFHSTRAAISLSILPLLPRAAWSRPPSRASILPRATTRYAA